MDLFEYQGKQFFAAVRHPGVARRRGHHRRRGRRRGRAASATRWWSRPRCRWAAGARPAASSWPTTPTRCATTPPNILGMDIKGHTVERIWIEQASDIAEEYYASFTLDRSAKKHLGMLSAQGGVEIEAVAEDEPRRHRQDLDRPGRRPHRGRGPGVGGRGASSTPQATEGAVDILLKLYRAYVEGDADLVEINPLILTPDGRGARPRRQGHPRRQRRRSATEYDEYEATQVRDEREQAAHEKGLQYVGLDGTVGIIANGAGLAMTTVDVVNQVGGQPANFLDIGGGANAEVMAGRARGHQQRPEGAGPSSSTSSAASPRARRWPTASSQALGRVDIELAHRDPPRRHQRRGGAGDPRRPRVRHAASPSRRCSRPPQAVVELAGK